MNELAKAAAFRMRARAAQIVAMLDTLEADPEPALAIAKLSSLGIDQERAFQDLRDALSPTSAADRTTGPQTPRSNSRN